MERPRIEGIWQESTNTFYFIISSHIHFLSVSLVLHVLTSQILIRYPQRYSIVNNQHFSPVMWGLISLFHES